MRSPSPSSSPGSDPERRPVPPVDLPEPFWCEERQEPPKVRVIPHGELDLSTAGQLDARIRELVTARWSCVVVDLGGLGFIDSTGVNLLIRWAHAARADGWALEVLPGGGAVHRVFELAGVIDSLPFAFDGDGTLRPHP